MHNFNCKTKIFIKIYAIVFIINRNVVELLLEVLRVKLGTNSEASLVFFQFGLLPCNFHNTC